MQENKIVCEHAHRHDYYIMDVLFILYNAHCKYTYDSTHTCCKTDRRVRV